MEGILVFGGRRGVVVNIDELEWKWFDKLDCICDWLFYLLDVFLGQLDFVIVIKQFDEMVLMMFGVMVLGCVFVFGDLWIFVDVVIGGEYVLNGEIGFEIEVGDV